MRHSPFTAVFDACVLYPAPLRDLLMWLGLSGLFRARWRVQIHAEWKRSTLGMEAQHPDMFVDNLFDLDQAAVVSAARQQRQTLNNPSVDVDRYLDILRKQGLIQTAKSLAAFGRVL